MKNPARKPSILLTAMLALVMTPTTQFALCVGDGGHRELELMSSDCCPTEPDHAHSHDGLEGGDDCADHCIDTPVGSVGAAGISSSTDNTDTDVPAANGHVAILAPAGLASPETNAEFGRDGPENGSPPLSFAKRSSVLRL